LRRCISKMYGASRQFMLVGLSRLEVQSQLAKRDSSAQTIFVMPLTVCGAT
jgi:hypothetical protein